MEVQPPAPDAAGPSGTLSVIPEETEEEKEAEKEEEAKQEEEEEKKAEDEDKDDNNQGDDASDDQPDSESSDDDNDSDSTGVALLARKAQFHGEASAGTPASRSEKACSASQSSDSSNARLRQLREAQCLRRLEAGEEVSDNSVSIHTEYSSDDETSPLSTSTTSPSDLQLMEIPQPSGLPPHLASVPEAICFFHQEQASRTVLLAPSLTTAISTWADSLKKTSGIQLQGTSVEKVHQLAAIV